MLKKNIVIAKGCPFFGTALCYYDALCLIQFLVPPTLRMRNLYLYSRYAPRWSDRGNALTSKSRDPNEVLALFWLSETQRMNQVDRTTQFYFLVLLL